mmetsp:Transcript_5614/g.12314  ORF Transcript_5614/g.12314 Transcript_5614/m.12314 type:complete len:133 (-) Transcript_5614:373-771(-)
MTRGGLFLATRKLARFAVYEADQTKERNVSDHANNRAGLFRGVYEKFPVNVIADKNVCSLNECLHQFEARSSSDASILSKIRNTYPETRRVAAVSTHTCQENGAKNDRKYCPLSLLGSGGFQTRTSEASYQG